MAFYRGMDGSALFAGQALAQMAGYSINVNLEELDTTVQGDKWKTVAGGLASWAGQATVRFDRAAVGQQQIVDEVIIANPAGAVAALEFRVNGTTKKFSGNALCRNIQIQSQMGQIVGATFDFTGSGPLTPAWS